MTRPVRMHRRTLLMSGVAATAALAGCGQSRLRSDPPVQPSAASVIGLITRTPFYVAHRGGGGDWPEMTGYAYQQASQVPGLQALEISACLTADGVLVCSHDPTTDRLTDKNYVIADQTWATLSKLKVSAEETGDRHQPARRLTKFEDVVDAYLDRFVLFVEPKVAEAVEPMLQMMVGKGQPERVVWKQPINSTTFETAKRHGFSTWGYVLNEPAHLGEHLINHAASPALDMLGAPQSESDTFVRNVVDAANGFGKPTIAWPVRDRADQGRMLRLGCRGLMVSNPAELLSSSR